MVLQHRPTTAPSTTGVTFLSSYRAPGSSATVWVQNKHGEVLTLVRWGDDLYVPLQVGDDFGVGVFNGSGSLKGYPFYVEGLNLFEKAPSEPEDCRSDQMWEIRPGQELVINKLMSEDGQNGRPFVMVDSGVGLNIGEATFGTSEFTGQIRVYERNSVSRVRPPLHHHSYHNDTYGQCKNLEEYTLKGLKSSGGERRTGPELESPRIGVGAGEEEHVSSYETGEQYDRTSRPVAVFRLEQRDDLEAMLGQHVPSSWRMRRPLGSPFTWRPISTGRVSSHIPYASHQGRGDR